MGTLHFPIPLSVLFFLITFFQKLTTKKQFHKWLV
nr:MAG TPA: hypothetical protein [Caudoviricetes sp.]